MKKVITQETIDFINKQQTTETYHPHKCNIKDCVKENKVLVATFEGMVCPCGKYKQGYR